MRGGGPTLAPTSFLKPVFKALAGDVFIQGRKSVSLKKLNSELEIDVKQNLFLAFDE